MTTVRTVDVRPLDLPLERPFEIALGTQAEARNVLARVETDDGIVGIGEGSPITAVTGETQGSALEVARAGASLVEGRDLDEYYSLVSDLRDAFSGNGSALAALETAVLDCYCRSRDVPLAALVGDAPRTVRTDLTVPIIGPDQAADRARQAWERGFETIKVKCGDGVEQSVERVSAVADATPDATLTVDGNQGFTPAETLQFVTALGDRGVSLDLVEQPVAKSDTSGLGDVRASIDPPVAADEAVFEPADAMRLCRTDAADVVNIKLGKSGFLGGRAVAAVARAADRSVMVGCMLESAVGVHAGAHLVSGLGGVAHVDLDANRLLGADVTDGPSGPPINPTGPGHGIDPNEAWRMIDGT